MFSQELALGPVGGFGFLFWPFSIPPRPFAFGEEADLAGQRQKHLDRIRLGLTNLTTEEFDTPKSSPPN